jgi:hypothetical protein
VVCIGRETAVVERQFAQYLGRTPDTASVEDLRRYQVHLYPTPAHRFQRFIGTPSRSGQVSNKPKLTAT